MSIFRFDSDYEKISHVFKLDTPNTSYVMAIVDDEGFIGHVYYGPRIEGDHVERSVRIEGYNTIPSENNRDRGVFYDTFPTEYSTHGIGDFRESCLEIETLQGFSSVGLTFDSYEIAAGKGCIKGLPSTFGSEEDVDTLILHCKDKPTGLAVDLVYSAFNDVDVITRRVVVKNEGREDIYIKKAYSACLDMDNRDFEVVSLHGSWARERHLESIKLGHSQIVVESHRGESSHQDHPFIMLKTPGTNDEFGDVYGMCFVYSGNFKATALNSQSGMVRMTMGISPIDFKWKLPVGESFETPEVVLVFSHEGTGKMTRIYHDLFRNHLIRSTYLHKKRPILINNWEATYFDFDTDKLISIAKKAASLGIEMLVMDDGWFGKRNDDNSSLGDWVVNEEKIKGGLKYLVDEVNKTGMKFGIWFEPEMISPVSELYSKHPDWAIAIPGRTPTRSRNQYVLDLSRKDVIDYTYEQVAGVLRSANIEYVKWDMNRQLTDLGSASLPKDRMGELSHRYVLGVYELQERLLKEFPNLLLENCSGGGARFDAGMLYYSPQIWCSDDTDAIERLKIQEGTALIYPLSSMGAHVSDCPNHTVGRVTPFETRGNVALSGTFGYELDVTRIPKEDVDEIPSQVALYHKYNDLIREGDYYRVANYSDNGIYDCYGVVSKDKKKALFTYVQVLNQPNMSSIRLYLKGLDPQKKYQLESNGKIYYGDVLMHAGYLQKRLWGDFKSELIYLTEVE